MGVLLRVLAEAEIEAQLSTPEVTEARQLVQTQMAALTKPAMVADMIEVCTAKPCFDKAWVMIRYRIRQEGSETNQLMARAMMVMMRAAGGHFAGGTSASEQQREGGPENARSHGQVKRQRRLDDFFG